MAKRDKKVGKAVPVEEVLQELGDPKTWPEEDARYEQSLRTKDLEFVDRILFGECLKILPRLPSNTYDSYVSDVPYGLGDKDPTLEEIVAYLQGADLVTGDFMGKDWNIPSIPIWREVYRVLKPGAHVLVFGGTRTFDLISMGLRAAGFENRDTIAHDHPALQWKQGQGMPKSHDIGKAVAKKTGATDSHVGEGTALKPSWEPILVFRKPIEKTLAYNAQKYGTGGLNIDASRVPHAGASDFEKHKSGVDAIKARGGSMANSWKNSSDLSGANDVTSAGRWPPNAVMTHSPECQKGDSGWACIEDCPVRQLDIQSGPMKATLAGLADPNVAHAHPGIDTTTDSSFFGKPRSHLGTVYADEGTASRFHPQFEGQNPVSPPFLYCAKAAKKETSLGGRILNDHPTRKPLKLMRWLLKLVTPKGGLVLDSFCGSGSTLHAAVLEGFHYTGVDRWDHAYKIATQRMKLVHEDLADQQQQEASFEAMGQMED